MAAEQVRSALAERDRHRAQRERAERFASGARARVGRAETAVATARRERDEAHQKAIAARRELKVEKSRLKATHRRELLALGRRIATTLEDALDRLRTREEFAGDDPHGTRQPDRQRAGRGEVVAELPTRANRAQRRAARKGRSRRRCQSSLWTT